MNNKIFSIIKIIISNTYIKNQYLIDFISRSV